MNNQEQTQSQPQPPKTTVKPDDREKLKRGVTGKGMDETIPIESLTTYSQDGVDLLKQHLAARWSIWDQERTLKESKSGNTDDLRMALEILGVKSVADPELGTVSNVISNRSSLDKKLLKEQLVLNGVDVAVVNSCMETATKTTEIDSIRYTAPKRWR